MYQVDFEALAQGKSARDKASQAYVGIITVINQANQARAAAGRMELRLVDSDSGSWSIFDILDCEMGLDEHVSIGGSSSSSRAVDNLLKLDPEFDKGSFIVIDRLEMHPEYRGYDLGLRAIDEAVEQLGDGCRWTLLLPYPLSCEAEEGLDGAKTLIVPIGGQQLELFPTIDSSGWIDSLRLDLFTSSAKDAVLALKRYYARNGFISLRGTSLMVRHLRSADVVETIDADVEVVAEEDLEPIAA
jgi:hypothetical protein